MRIFLCSLIACLLAGSAAAQTADSKISIEFNDLQEGQSGCRAVFVLHNGLTKALDALTLRLVAFDAKGQANLFLSLDVGAMPANKTRVLRFDLGDGVACKDVSRLVLDDVSNCSGADIDPASCLGLLALSSRLDVPFDF